MSGDDHNQGEGRTPGCKRKSCYVYFCPTSNEWECSRHSGFDVCCDHPACPSFRARGEVSS